MESYASTGTRFAAELGELVQTTELPKARFSSTLTTYSSSFLLLWMGKIRICLSPCVITRPHVLRRLCEAIGGALFLDLRIKTATHAFVYVNASRVLMLIANIILVDHFATQEVALNTIACHMYVVVFLGSWHEGTWMNSFITSCLQDTVPARAIKDHDICSLLPGSDTSGMELSEV